VSDADAIVALNREWAACFKRRDVAGLVSLFTEDCVRLPEGGPMSVGKPALETAYREEFGPIWASEFDVSIDTGEVVVSGDFAFARGTDRLVPRGGDAYEGKWLAVYRRQPDGSWKYFWSTSNSNA